MVLKKGMTGKQVKWLQTSLNKLGASLIVDGIFGEETEKAVRKFQAIHNLKVDGIVGPQTRKAILKELAKNVIKKPKIETPKYSFEVDLIPINRRNRVGKKLTKLMWITIHDTSNSTKGADAKAHAKYLKSQSAEERMVSVHAFVDDKRVIQTLPFDEVAYHTGTNEGNLTSIGIEICENIDGNRKQAEENAAHFVAQLLKKYNLPITAVRTHESWKQYGNRGKFCPRVILSRPQGWEEFVSKIRKYLGV